MPSRKAKVFLAVLAVLGVGFGLWVGRAGVGLAFEGPGSSAVDVEVSSLSGEARPAGTAYFGPDASILRASDVVGAASTQGGASAESEPQSHSSTARANPMAMAGRAQDSGSMAASGVDRSAAEHSAVGADRSLAEILDGVDMANPAMREQVVAQLQARSTQRREGVVEKANRLNIPLQIFAEDGRLVALQDFDGDRPLYYGTMNANAAISGGVVPLRTAPYTLDGSGLTVGVWDGGSVRSSHQELTGRTTLRNTSAAIDDHATHVAGTIAASGVSASAKGMAPNIKIDSYDWNNDLAEMAAAGAASASDTARLPISNHSYGYITGYLRTGANRWRWFGHGTTVDSVDEDFGRYHSHTRDWDALAYSLPYYTIFKAAGNDRTDNPSAGDRIDNTSGTLLFTYDGASHPGGDGVYLNGYGSISFASVAKNVITIGAVHDAVSGGQRSVGAAAMSSFSSWGPTDDGRIKPDLVANGVTLESSTAGGNDSYGSSSGTSMASPAAAGAAALLVQLYRREFADQLPTSSLLKALLIHTADDLGTVGPNYRFGWGLVNAERAAALILEHKNSAGTPRFIESQITSQASTYTHEISWDGSSPIRVTLCWTDPAGPVQSGRDSRAPVLVHNLDLQVTGPGDQTFNPYVMPFVGTWTPESMDLAATTGKNNVDTIEQVHIATPPQAGVYTIRVSLDGELTRSSQSFSLIVTGGTSADVDTRIVSLSGDLSFGAVPVDQAATRELVIQNLGNAPLQVDGLVLPTGFSGSWSGTIAPGSSQPVPITFLPTQAISYSGALQVLSDATSGINTRSVSGTGVLDITPLSNGVSVLDLAGTSGSETFFVLAVPEGQAELRFVISGGGGGDADLYVRYGSLPTVNQWDYRPYLSGSEETVAISNPSAGNWYVMIHGYSAYSALTLTGSYEAPVDITSVIRLTGDLAFGNIPVGASVERYATVHNDGNTALAVSGITLPSGYVGAWSGSIAPGGSQVVPVTFTPDAAQVYEGFLVVESDKTAGENSLSVSGSGITDAIPLQNGVAAGPFSAQAGSMLYFFLDVPEEQSTFTVQIDGEENQADLYLRRGEMPDLDTYDHRTADGGQVVAVTNPVSGRWYIMLHALTQYTGIRLTASYEDEDAPGTKVIRLEGDLDFGSVRVQESAIRSFVIFNDGNSPLNVSGISYPSGYSGIGTPTVPPGEHRPVSVTFAPMQEGSFDGELIVQSDATSGNSSLALSGQGVASDAVVPLKSGVSVGGIAGTQGSEQYYVISVPPGASYLEVAISGGSGDADLYVRYGALPTLEDWDYRPYFFGNEEVAVIQAPAEGNWYIMLHGWEAYSGVSLVATIAFPVDLAPVYRFWSPVFSGHFFTINPAERDHIMATWPDVWQYEGVAWRAHAAPAAGTSPVYRFWSPVFSRHFFTISLTERDHIMATWPDIWHYEGVAWHAYVSAGSGRSPIYRLWSPVLQGHFFTINAAERDHIMATWPDIWTYEGIAYYAYAASAGAMGSSMAYDETNAELTAETKDAGDLAGLLLDAWQADAVVQKPLMPAVASKESPVADTVVELDSDGVYFPLQYTNTYVAASVYDSELAAWEHVLAPSWEPDGVWVAGNTTNHHWLAVLTYDAGAEVWGVTHGSWFGRLLQPEAGDPGVVLADDVPVEVGLPVEALLLPAEPGEMLLLVYDVAEEAYIETIPGLKGGARYAWTVPQWNRWYRLDIVRKADGEVLQSQWVGHMRTH